MPDLYVARGVELRVSNSPDKTQVRYFFPEDKPTAERVADILAERLPRRPDVELIGGYQKKIRPGLVELWLGKTLPVGTGRL